MAFYCRADKIVAVFYRLCLISGPEILVNTQVLKTDLLDCKKHIFHVTQVKNVDMLATEGLKIVVLVWQICINKQSCVRKDL